LQSYCFSKKIAASSLSTIRRLTTNVSSLQRGAPTLPSPFHAESRQGFHSEVLQAGDSCLLVLHIPFDGQIDRKESIATSNLALTQSGCHVKQQNGLL